jgi:hypothetical protein
MAQQGFLQDLEVFIQERAAGFDESLDVSPGSPFDTRVIQPILRRIGTDPFSTDVELFIQDRLNQEFPELVTKSGDALTDLLIKPLRLLLDPIRRENERVKRSLSFKDSDLLIEEEADALGANLFAERETGSLARVPMRIYFSSPQNIVVSPANFGKSRGGLRFFPDSTQSIRADEMLLNQEGTLFYFDVNLVAEKAGDEYNIGPDELVSVANVPAAVRVTNKRRARFGAPAESATEFVDRAKGELTERSLVTDRGIQAVLPKIFPDITRLAVVGFNDPEMQRDRLEGGGVGPIVASGLLAQPMSDGQAKAYSRRIQINASENPKFLTRIGPAGAVKGWVITLLNAMPSSTTEIRDFDVVRVVDDQTLEVADQVLSYIAAPIGPWMLRRKLLSLSHIPGGILFPDTAQGTLEVPDGTVHIGGCTDIYVRGVDLDTGTISVSNLTDDSPVLQGIEGETLAGNQVKLHDLELGIDYQENDDTYVALRDAVKNRVALRILAGGAAGTYSILSVTQTATLPPVITLREGPTVLLNGLRWQLLDSIDVDLLEPKETRLTGDDAQTVLGSDVVETWTGLNLASFGVTAGDTFRILKGPDKGDYEIKALAGLFNTQVKIDALMTHSLANLSFAIFRANTSGGLQLPLVRITSIDLLDSTGQPVGTSIPYALPVGVTSEAFANTASGVKVDVTDARLGLVGQAPMATTITAVTGLSLKFRYGITTQNPLLGGTLVVVTFPGVSYTRQGIVDRINQVFGSPIATLTPDGRLGLLPYDSSTTTVLASENHIDVLLHLFGSTTFTGTTRWVKSQTVGTYIGGWTSSTISPPIDRTLDAFQVIDGVQTGPRTGPRATVDYLELAVGQDLTPEANVHVQVGARSLGVARMYFLEPTSSEIGPETTFTAELSNGAKIDFIPDPTNSAQKVPALPSAVRPKDGQCLTTSTFRSGNVSTGTIDFIKAGVEVGDHLVLDYLPLIGSVAIVDPVPNLHGKNLILAVEGLPDQTITFVNDSASIAPTSVTRKAVAEQINSQVGKKIASINSLNKLELDASFLLTIKTTGTANTSIGFPGLTTHLRNESPNKAAFPILSISLASPRELVLDTTDRALVTALTGDLATFSDLTRQQFSVVRPGAQRISVTEMSANVGEGGLYYWDVQLMSSGTGDIYNISDRTELHVQGCRSDGYWLTTDIEELSFSTTERPRLHLSRSILPIGVNDDPQNALDLSGQNLQVNYERSALVSNVQAYVSAESERVTNNSPLVRHLTPYFFRVDLSYTGGAKERDLRPVIETYVKDLFPSDGLESSDLQKLLTDSGATSVENPLELFAVVHKEDRSVVLERSQNRLNTGRLAAFIPDVLNLTRAV